VQIIPLQYRDGTRHTRSACSCHKPDSTLFVVKSTLYTYYTRRDDSVNLGGRGSARCSSSAVDLHRAASGTSLNLQPPAFNDPPRCPRCHRAGSKHKPPGTGKRRSKCVKLCVPAVLTQGPPANDAAPRPTQSGLLAPSTAALTTRRHCSSLCLVKRAELWRRW